MTKVKICGLSTVEAVKAAVESGADYLGFVFAPSRRQVSVAQAQALATHIPSSIKKVGVFVSPSRSQLEEAVRGVPLDLVQIHGDFDSTLLTGLGVPLIKAVQIKGKTDWDSGGADFLLFDAPLAGSGKPFDWRLLETTELGLPFFIAGGLTVDNVGDAVARFRPYALDVSSGVETDGQKDPAKIRKFIERVKA